jgi:uncharacterized membrane protein
MITTKISTVSATIVAGLAVVALVFSWQAQAGTKVAVCHMTSSAKNPIVNLVISSYALQAHLDHGDVLYSAETGCSTDDGGGPDPV